MNYVREREGVLPRLNDKQRGLRGGEDVFCEMEGAWLEEEEREEMEEEEEEEKKKFVA